MNGLMNLKKQKSLFAALTILSATLAGVSGCRTAQPILESVIVRDTVIVTDTKYLIDTLEVMKDTVIYQDKVRLQLQYIDRKVVVEAMCCLTRSVSPKRRSSPSKSQSARVGTLTKWCLVLF
jgi:hypothetical protein